MTHDGPPPRHLHPVTGHTGHPSHGDEPPFDPDYDKPRDTRQPPADRAAEAAVLGALLAEPTLGPTLQPHLNADDFYWPHHGHLWDTWHHLATTQGTPPDPITLNHHLIATGDAEAARALPDLLTACPNPAAAEHYAQIVRDTARLRVVDDLATGLHQLATRGNPTHIDHYLGEALQRLDDTVTRFGPTISRTPTALADLSWIIDGEPPTSPPPAYVTRTDGHALFYRGQVNGIFGDPEHGKTWVAQCAAVEALQAGGTAAMIDVDHNGPNHTAARLLMLGAPIVALANPERFRYYEPHDATDLIEAVNDITTRAPDVVIIDSLGEIFPMLGVKTNDSDELTAAMRQVCTRPAQAGSCVITIDHLPKSSEARASGFAIGSIAKKRMIRGAYLRAEARTKPAPGQIGRITLRIEKDTTGELRRSSAGGYAGTFVLDTAAVEGAAKWSVSRDEAPKNDDGTFRPTYLMEKVSRFVEDNDQCTFRDIKTGVRLNTKCTDDTLRKAIATLVSDGFIFRISGPKNSHLHHSNVTYREDEDDHA